MWSQISGSLTHLLELGVRGKKEKVRCSCIQCKETKH